MKITDAPFPVGTPEHSEWVRTELIQWQQVEVDRYDAEHGRAHRLGSAESQGRSVIRPQMGDSFDEDGNVVRWSTTLAETIKRANQAAAAMRPAWVIFDDITRDAIRATNQLTVFMEPWQGLTRFQGSINWTSSDKGQLDIGIIEPAAPRKVFVDKWGRPDEQAIVRAALDPAEPLRLEPLEQRPSFLPEPSGAVHADVLKMVDERVSRGSARPAQPFPRR